MSSENTDTIPWVEKYRPSHFENIVLDPTNRDFFKEIHFEPPVENSVHFLSIIGS
jgi:hypothetical protein